MPVYFIQAGAGEAVKIGVSTDPWKRLSGLQTSQTRSLRIIRLFEGGAAEERDLHQRFAAHRISGEWFNPVADIVKGAIDLPALPVERPVRRPTEWSEERYLQYCQKIAASRLDPVGEARRLHARHLCGARIGVASSLGKAGEAIGRMGGRSGPDVQMARRDLTKILAKLEAYHAKFPNLIAETRRGAGRSDAFVQRRLVTAFDAFVAAHVSPTQAPA